MDLAYLWVRGGGALFFDGVQPSRLLPNQSSLDSRPVSKRGTSVPGLAGETLQWAKSPVIELMSELEVGGGYMETHVCCGTTARSFTPLAALTLKRLKG